MDYLTRLRVKSLEKKVKVLQEQMERVFIELEKSRDNGELGSTAKSQQLGTAESKEVRSVKK